MKNKKTIILLLIIGFAFFSQKHSYSQDREYLIKSAFIEKMTRFITWPNAKIDQKKEVVLGVVTPDDQIFETIKFYFSDQKIQQKNVLVKQIKDHTNLKDIDLVFVTNGTDVKVLEFLEDPANCECLLIFDNFNQPDSCVHINLTTKNNKIGFQIDPNLLSENGFYVSSKLVSYGQIINCKQHD